jgi:hypothetical protein
MARKELRRDLGFVLRNVPERFGNSPVLPSETLVQEGLIFWYFCIKAKVQRTIQQILIILLHTPTHIPLNILIQLLQYPISENIKLNSWQMYAYWFRF